MSGRSGRRADAGDDAPDRLARRLDAVRRRFSLSDRYGSITGPRSENPIGARKNRDDTRSAHREASVRDLIANLGVTEDNPNAAAIEPERSAPRAKDCAAQPHHRSRRRLNAGRPSRTGARAKSSLFSRTDPWPAREQARPERLTDVRLGRHYPPKGRHFGAQDMPDSRLDIRAAEFLACGLPTRARKRLKTDLRR